MSVYLLLLDIFKGIIKISSLSLPLYKILICGPVPPLIFNWFWYVDIFQILALALSWVGNTFSNTLLNKSKFKKVLFHVFQSLISYFNMTEELLWPTQYFISIDYFFSLCQFSYRYQKIENPVFALSNSVQCLVKIWQLDTTQRWDKYMTCIGIVWIGLWEIEIIY